MKSGSRPDCSMFTSAQATTILRTFHRGHRLDDVFRLAFGTRCRVDEIASLTIADVETLDFSGFTVRTGKSINVARRIPLVEPAQGLLRARLEGLVGGSGRCSLWPGPYAGKSPALPATFTRKGRKLLEAALQGSAPRRRCSARLSRRDAPPLGRRIIEPPTPAAGKPFAFRGLSGFRWFAGVSWSVGSGSGRGGGSRGARASCK